MARFDGVSRSPRDPVQELAEIHTKVSELFALVADGLVGATDALLSGDRDSAMGLIARDALVDELYLEIEDLVQRQFALQAPVANDMRYLLGMLRIVPELERSGDLVEHIAKRAIRGVGASLPPRMRGLIERMGGVGGALWRQAAGAYELRDPDAVTHMRTYDNELDELHAMFIAEIVEAELPMPVAIDLALVGRFYERLGDHAVNVAQRLRYVANGESRRL